MNTIFFCKIGVIFTSVAAVAVGCMALKDKQEVQCNGDQCFIVPKERVKHSDRPDEELLIEKQIRRGGDGSVEIIYELNNRAGW